MKRTHNEVSWSKLKDVKDVDGYQERRMQSECIQGKKKHMTKQ